MSAEGVYGQAKNKQFRTYDDSAKFAKSDPMEINRCQNQDHIFDKKQQLPQFYHQNHHNFPENFEKQSKNKSNASDSDDSITSDLYNFQTRSNKIKMQSSTNGDTISSNNANPNWRRGKPPI